MVIVVEISLKTVWSMYVLFHGIFFAWFLMRLESYHRQFLWEKIKDIGLLGLDYIGGRNHWIRGTSLLSLTILTSFCGLLLAPKACEASARTFYFCSSLNGYCVNNITIYSIFWIEKAPPLALLDFFWKFIRFGTVMTSPVPRFDSMLRGLLCEERLTCFSWWFSARLIFKR